MDDANLILRLYELRREDKMRAARAWFTSKFHAKTLAEFQVLCPPGTDENAHFRQVTSYWEMACSFVTSGVLQDELFVQNSLELLVVWEKLKSVAPEIRKANNAPMAYKNLEAVAGIAAQYLDKHGEGVYDSFAKRWR